MSAFRASAAFNPRIAITPRSPQLGFFFARKRGLVRYSQPELRPSRRHVSWLKHGLAFELLIIERA